jgi:hypothetical protein
VTGLVVSFAFSTTILTACGAVALAYYPLATVVTGRSLSTSRLKWLVGRLRSTAAPVEDEEPATLYLVPRLTPSPQAVPAPPLVTVSTEDTPARQSAAV